MYHVIVISSFKNDNHKIKFYDAWNKPLDTNNCCGLFRYDWYKSISLKVCRAVWHCLLLTADMA